MILHINTDWLHDITHKYMMLYIRMLHLVITVTYFYIVNSDTVRGVDIVPDTQVGLVLCHDNITQWYPLRKEGSSYTLTNTVGLLTCT